VIVKVGIEGDTRTQITKGLNEGDKVVTSAQFLIDSESNIDAELARMELPKGSSAIGVSSDVMNMKGINVKGKDLKGADK